METREDRDLTTLLIRHLPEQFSKEKRIEFCHYYGAVSATIMPDKGKMKYCAFAYFPDPASATNALHKLHQMTIHGRTLSVEYARRTQSQRYRSNDVAPSPNNLKKADGAEKNKESRLLDKIQEEQQVFMKGPISLVALSEKLGLKYPLNPTLRYNYPKPTQQIIMNIANTLVSVPKFYTQVLHLMNKMNLPAPFSLNSFPAPPLPQEEMEEKPPEPDEMEISSEEESELESDEENQDKRPKDVFPVKRPSKRRSTKPKRPRLEQLLAASKGLPKADTGGQVFNPSEVFEEPAVSLKKPEIRLAEGIATALSKQVQGDIAQEPSQPHPGGSDVTGSFGTFNPAPPSSKKEDEEASEEEEESSDFIKKEQLKNKISKEEMKRMSVFKNYNPGEPNTRLYIKNLSKQVEEKDLKFIFGRYVDWTSALDKDMFSIQLMKQGRMKGQAFVALPSEFAAKKAVKETNGYLLQGKPLVVVFARSAKPKPQQEDKKS